MIETTIHTDHREEIAPRQAPTATPPPAPVTVMSGVFVQSLPLVGRSVAAVRREFAVRMDIDRRAEALLDGQAVSESEDTILLKPGQTLIFTRRAGQRG